MCCGISLEPFSSASSSHSVRQRIFLLWLFAIDVWDASLFCCCFFFVFDTFLSFLLLMLARASHNAHNARSSYLSVLTTNAKPSTCDPLCCALYFFCFIPTLYVCVCVIICIGLFFVICFFATFARVAAWWQYLFVGIGNVLAYGRMKCERASVRLYAFYFSSSHFLPTNFVESWFYSL